MTPDHAGNWEKYLCLTLTEKSPEREYYCTLIDEEREEGGEGGREERGREGGGREGEWRGRKGGRRETEEGREGEREERRRENSVH